MKKYWVFLLTIMLLIFTAGAASALPVLYDWTVDVNGAISHPLEVEEYGPVTTGGYITEVTDFVMTMPDPDFYDNDVPTALGSLEITFNPGAAGSYSISAYFDAEFDEWINGWDNEEGGSNGSAATNQTWQIDELSENWLGPDFGHDIAFGMGWNFDLLEDQSAVVVFSIFGEMPDDTFYLFHKDLETKETIYLASTLEIKGGQQPVPEPATLVLLGTGLFGLCASARRRMVKK